MAKYNGRLAFDPDLNCHVDPEGKPVVTEDGGKTWRYAKVNDDGSLSEGEPSHYERYHEGFAVVDGTANRLFELQMEHGEKRAEELMREEQPHHFEIHPSDPHYEKGAKNSAGVVTHTRTRSVPDQKSAVLTGHTDATAWEHNDA